MSQALESIILAGDNQGILSIYKGLQSYCDKVFIHTNTPDVLSKRKCDEFVNGFFDVDCQLVLCSAYAPLLKQDVLEKKNFLNIHYALLPRYRGMHPVVWGILSDEPELGWTLHKMDKGMDSGPVIYQYRVKNDDKITSTQYMEMFHQAVEDNIGQAVVDYVNGDLVAKHQDHSKAAWGVRRNLDDCDLDFAMSHNEIRNFFRALVKPYPRPVIRLNGERFFIEEYRLHNQNIKAVTLGRVVNIDEQGIWIKVKEGYLLASKLSYENGEEVDYRAKFKIGSRLDV